MKQLLSSSHFCHIRKCTSKPWRADWRGNWNATSKYIVFEGPEKKEGVNREADQRASWNMILTETASELTGSWVDDVIDCMTPFLCF